MLGLVPQCGFSVAAANFYAGRLITPGTLVAVFLATSDEALPILVSQPGALPDLLLLLGVKLVAGAVFGILTDLLWKRLPHRAPERPFEELCKDCDCEHHGIFRSALTHTVRIALFFAAHQPGAGRRHPRGGGGAHLPGAALRQRAPALCGGAAWLYPNCASSVILTELYLAGSLSFGAAVAGLCTGAGVGLAVLFKYNRHWKENLLLAAILYVSAVATGLVCGAMF